jgi:hypothetical protein
LFGVENGIAVDEDNVAADAQGWKGFCKLHGVGESAAISHQSGRRDNSVCVGLGDGAIDAGGEAEVIGVDDQTAHLGSLAGQEYVPAFREFLDGKMIEPRHLISTRGG